MQLKKLTKKIIISDPDFYLWAVFRKRRSLNSLNYLAPHFSRPPALNE
jgi:hypothetical protein